MEEDENRLLAESLQNEAYGGANAGGSGAGNIGGGLAGAMGGGMGEEQVRVDDIADTVPLTEERLIDDTPRIRNPFASSRW